MVQVMMMFVNPPWNGIQVINSGVLMPSRLWRLPTRKDIGHLRSRKRLNKRKNSLPPRLLGSFRLWSTHYGESRGGAGSLESRRLRMPPLVALRYKEWPYGGQTPWEEKKLE